MSDNPFANRPIYGRDVAMIMRDINKIEASLGSGENGLIDIVIVIDTSGSMVGVISAVKQNVAQIFEQVTAQIAGARVGLIEQGDWDKDSTCRCQPTDDTSVFQAAIDAFGSCLGANEAYVDSLIMAVEGTQWRPGATRLVIIIGDEGADQAARSGNAWSEAIAVAQSANVIVSMIIATASSESWCLPSYPQATDATGGVLLIAPSNEDVVGMISVMVAHFVYEQTEFFRYTPTARISLGLPDGGVTVPPDNAVANSPFTPNPLVDMRNAVVRIVAAGRLRATSGQPFNWTNGSADNLYRVAMGDRTRYGGTSGPRYTWTRSITDLVHTPPRDLDIGEVYECVRVLKSAAGV